VLVDTIVPPRAHEHGDADEPDPTATRATPAGQGSDPVRLSGRTRQNKLVHLTGPAGWLGSLVDVRVDHAGAYALRGAASRTTTGSRPG
jgi:hypothetical protein